MGWKMNGKEIYFGTDFAVLSICYSPNLIIDLSIPDLMVLARQGEELIHNRRYISCGIILFHLAYILLFTPGIKFHIVH